MLAGVVAVALLSVAVAALLAVGPKSSSRGVVARGARYRPPVRDATNPTPTPTPATPTPHQHPNPAHSGGGGHGGWEGGGLKGGVGETGGVGRRAEKEGGLEDTVREGVSRSDASRSDARGKQLGVVKMRVPVDGSKEVRAPPREFVPVVRRVC
jgi:hypothetical protein